MSQMPVVKAVAPDHSGLPESSSAAGLTCSSLPSSSRTLCDAKVLDTHLLSTKRKRPSEFTARTVTARLHGSGSVMVLVILPTACPAQMKPAGPTGRPECALSTSMKSRRARRNPPTCWMRWSTASTAEGGTMRRRYLGLQCQDTSSVQED